MAKKKNVFKRIMFVVLFIILIPVVLIFLIVRAISKKARYNIYKRNKVSGRKLVMTTTIESLSKMESFEVDDFFKYLFFYQGFSTKKLDNTKNCLILEKNNRLFVLVYETKKGASHDKNVVLLSELMRKNNISTGIYATNAELGEQFKIQSKKENIDVVDKASLALLIQNVSKELELAADNFGPETDKSVDELLSVMYPNSI